MSRYILVPLHETHKIIVGWDPPLSTFFAHVEDVTITEETADPYVFQVGQRFMDFTRIEIFAAVLAPYARIPDDIMAQLLADQHMPYQRSALQERMVQFFA